MEAKKFKTTINCGNCLAKVTPTLDRLVGEKNWKVDINDPDKILTLDKEQDASEVKKNLLKIGFLAEPV